MRYSVLTILLCFCVPTQAEEELRFAKIFTDHGVLQREMPVPVWGWAHRVSNTVIFNEEKDFSVQKGTVFSQASNRVRKN